MAASPTGTPSAASPTPGDALDPAAAPSGPALNAARAIAAGRLAIGAALVAATGIAAPWMGTKAAASPGGRVAIRALGVRDLVLGAMTLHVVGHPQAGPRWLATCAVADVVDGAATWAARHDLPSGALPVAAVAAGAAVGQVAIAGLLSRG
jgi:hypothetical protein